MTRAADGGTPNGPSTNAVISGDRRYSRIIAFYMVFDSPASLDAPEGTHQVWLRWLGAV